MIPKNLPAVDAEPAKPVVPLAELLRQIARHPQLPDLIEILAKSIERGEVPKSVSNVRAT
jgi:hypothetical protein